MGEKAPPFFSFFASDTAAAGAAAGTGEEGFLRGLGAGVAGAWTSADEEEEEDGGEEEEEEGGGGDQGSFLAWMPERRTSKGLVLKNE